MSSNSGRSSLLIFEYNGTARSGKGTIVRYLAENHERATVEETGIDYRAVTRALISDGAINAAMSEPEVLTTVKSLGLQALADIVSNRVAILAEHGAESFYQPDVNGLVATVGKVEAARKAVKDGFRARVEAVRDKAEHQILLVDGRDLAKVLKDISGTRLVLRTFVTCSVPEAARRECLRSGVEINSPGGQAILASLDKRTQADAMRQLDPVKPDSDALDYWHPPHGASREELGELAVRVSRQVYFDTTAFSGFSDSKQAMLEAADQMFSSALSAAKQSTAG